VVYSGSAKPESSADLGSKSVKSRAANQQVVALSLDSAGDGKMSVQSKIVETVTEHPNEHLGESTPKVA
jgi:hypothetical protein